MQKRSGKVSVTLAPGLTSRAETGRMFVIVTDQPDKEPRLVTAYTHTYYFNDISRGAYAPFFGQDVDAFQPGAMTTLEGAEEGFPFVKFADLPPGEYYVQALLHRYERVTPPHGKTIWLPMDRGEGSQFHLAPGNFYSEVRKVTVSADQPLEASLTLQNTIPPIALPKDTALARFRTFRSRLASEFWGRDIQLGMNVVLPRGYDENPDAHYPVVFHMGHQMEFVPFFFPTEEPEKTDTPATLYSQRWKWERWHDADTPRVILVTLIHTTPFYDDSYFVNSPNTGPWLDILMEEFLPYLNREFRTIDAPWARVMTGASTGGWISLYLQITRPESFGGAWVYCPDMVDYRALVQTDIYRESNYFTPDGYGWLKPERPYARTVEGKWSVSARDFARLSGGLGSKCRGGEWIDNYAAMYGPGGDDGYPVPLIDWKTGAIDNRVAETWRDNGFDLRHHMETNWKTLGPKVEGQLRFLCGDMDQFYCNTALYLLEDFLKETKDPHYGGSFRWGRPKIGHTTVGVGLDPYPFALFREMAEHMRARAPQNFDHGKWYCPPA